MTAPRKVFYLPPEPGWLSLDEDGNPMWIPLEGGCIHNDFPGTLAKPGPNAPTNNAYNVVLRNDDVAYGDFP